MLHGQVVDKLLNEHRLAYAGATKQTGFAAADVGLQQVDGLDAGFEDLHRGGEVVEARRWVMDGIVLHVLRHALAVHRLAQHVPDAAQSGLAYRHLHGLAGIHHMQAALQTVGGGHGDGAYNAARQLGLHLKLGLDVAKRSHCIYLEGGIDSGHVVLEFDVDHRAYDTDNDALVEVALIVDRGFENAVEVQRRELGLLCHYFSSNAAAPPTISLISVVIEL